MIDDNNKKSGIKIESKVVHGYKGYDPLTGAISIPIYQTATFRHSALYEKAGYDYSRVQNPTREELEDTIAILEGGKYGFAFSSGLAAVVAIFSMLRAGDHVVVSDDLYGGTYRLIEEIWVKYNTEFTYVDTSRVEKVEEALRPNTRMVFIETPTNPMMKVADIAAIVGLVKSRGILTVVDNTFLTPFFQRPIEFGADIVIHSATKFLAGHHDTMAGLVVVEKESLAEKLRLILKTEGSGLSPFDSWLVLRGIKTLALRMERHQKNAVMVADWLKTHPKVERVYFVGLPEHESYQISKRQSDGFGGMISFTVKDVALVEQVLQKVELIIFAESLGGTESLITYPMVQTHASIPQEIRERVGITDKLLRLSVGIENVEDIINDLDQALA
ncbi:PLP-dependent aspartate aminotransferase family protein [Pelotomaculum terephthalicicum JT]|uniref:trans-sulfuration enzyme family protein n=1 Tax=Pelotomaculum TaxID=191373 RepID=UPI0009CF8CF0|nr:MULTISPECIES: PLP-dependent aspartate aminotransferase family protein [Pelotomaculum]MCG9969074.1 PLP-dependent aspartate aminotransferase family protein [Pelotomaculum terephthalicicum JT]OPX87406.1 MAG: Cystathionine gamma-synthase [Pelotomaculum sp. PtaB.Bin117]OPY60899.1 MAG: Cystathionine gamma-synthase [Pelotomaculum sp. PtaU1.Bin065]